MSRWWLLRRVLAAGVLAVLASALAWNGAGAHRAAQDFPPKPGTTPIVVGLPNLNPSPGPTAKPGSGGPKPAPPASHGPSAAVRIALASPYVRALLNGRRYHVASEQAWKAVAGGKLANLALDRPGTVTGRWLAMGRIPYRATYHNVRSLRVWVDVPRRVVDEIQPGR